MVNCRLWTQLSSCRGKYYFPSQIHLLCMEGLCLGGIGSSSLLMLPFYQLSNKYQHFSRYSHELYIIASTLYKRLLYIFSFTFLYFLYLLNISLLWYSGIFLFLFSSGIGAITGTSGIADILKRLVLHHTHGIQYNVGFMGYNAQSHS